MVLEHPAVWERLNTLASGFPREGLIDVLTFSRLDAADIRAIRSAGLDVLSSLLVKENASDWEQGVIAASAIFSRGALTSDPAIRLVHQFSALESLLLRSETEPIQQNVGERAAFYLHETAGDRAGLTRLFRQVYAQRSRYVHHGRDINDEDALKQFAPLATQLMWKIVREAPRFSTRDEFIRHIDQVKFS